MKKIGSRRIGALLGSATLVTVALTCGMSTASASSDDPGWYNHIGIAHMVLNSKLVKKQSNFFDDYSTNICATDHDGHVTIWKNGHEARDYWYVPKCVNNLPGQSGDVDPGMGVGPYTFYIAPVPGDPNPPSNFCVDFSANYRSYSPNSFNGNCDPGSPVTTSYGVS
jgi:hypothetical protein